jgi:hypothetical protein
LQQGEDFAVDGVERGHWDKLGLNGSQVVFYPNLKGFVAKI